MEALSALRQGQTSQDDLSASTSETILLRWRYIQWQYTYGTKPKARKAPVNINMFSHVFSRKSLENKFPADYPKLDEDHWEKVTCVSKPDWQMVFGKPPAGSVRRGTLYGKKGTKLIVLALPDLLALMKDQTEKKKLQDECQKFEDQVPQFLANCTADTEDRINQMVRELERLEREIVQDWSEMSQERDRLINPQSSLGSSIMKVLDSELSESYGGPIEAPPKPYSLDWKLTPRVFREMDRLCLLVGAIGGWQELRAEWADTSYGLIPPQEFAQKCAQTFWDDVVQRCKDSIRRRGEIRAEAFLSEDPISQRVPHRENRLRACLADLVRAQQSVDFERSRNTYIKDRVKERRARRKRLLGIVKQALSSKFEIEDRDLRPLQKWCEELHTKFDEYFYCQEWLNDDVEGWSVECSEPVEKFSECIIVLSDDESELQDASANIPRVDHTQIHATEAGESPVGQLAETDLADLSVPDVASEPLANELRTSGADAISEQPLSAGSGAERRSEEQLEGAASWKVPEAASKPSASDPLTTGADVTSEQPLSGCSDVERRVVLPGYLRRNRYGGKRKLQATREERSSHGRLVQPSALGFVPALVFVPASKRSKAAQHGHSDSAGRSKGPVGRPELPSAGQALNQLGERYDALPVFGPRATVQPSESIVAPRDLNDGLFVASLLSLEEYPTDLTVH